MKPKLKIAEVLDTFRTELGTPEKRLKEIGRWLLEREKAREGKRRKVAKAKAARKKGSKR